MTFRTLGLRSQIPEWTFEAIPDWELTDGSLRLVDGPTKSPPTSGAVRVVGGYDQGFGANMVLCETLAKMQALYAAYAQGWATMLIWFRGTPPEGEMITYPFEPSYVGPQPDPLVFSLGITVPNAAQHDLILTLAQKIPGAAVACGELVRYGGFEVLALLERSGLAGKDLWTFYCDTCRRDPAKALRLLGERGLHLT